MKSMDRAWRLRIAVIEAITPSYVARAKVAYYCGDFD